MGDGRSISFLGRWQNQKDLPWGEYANNESRLVERTLPHQFEPVERQPPLLNYRLKGYLESSLNQCDSSPLLVSGGYSR